MVVHAHQDHVVDVHGSPFSSWRRGSAARRSRTARARGAVAVKVFATAVSPDRRRGRRWRRRTPRTAVVRGDSEAVTVGSPFGVGGHRGFDLHPNPVQNLGDHRQRRVPDRGERALLGVAPGGDEAAVSSVQAFSSASKPRSAVSCLALLRVATRPMMSGLMTLSARWKSSTVGGGPPARCRPAGRRPGWTGSG